MHATQRMLFEYYSTSRAICSKARQVHEIVAISQPHVTFWYFFRLYTIGESFRYLYPCQLESADKTTHCLEKLALHRIYLREIESLKNW